MPQSTLQQMLGMRGEGHVDGKVWIIKCLTLIPGFPFKPYASNKTVMCVRNPLDVFPSLAAFMGSMSHSSKYEFELEKEFPEWWDEFLTFARKAHK